MRRLAPILVIGLGLGLFFAAGLHRILSFETLAAERKTLLAFVADNLASALALYVIAYTLIVALSAPGGAVMTLAGGFLFGPVIGGSATVIAATLGATLLFLAARTAFGEALRARAGPGLRAFEAGFRRDAFNYLLVLRLVPLFPFFLVNLAPAFLGVPLRTYVLATGIGILPGTFVFASIGNGLGAVFDRGGKPDLSLILAPEILLPLIGLAVLALIPVAYRRWSARS